MAIVGGLDIHRKQITFDYQDTVTGQVRRGQSTCAPGWRGSATPMQRPARLPGTAHGDPADLCPADAPVELRVKVRSSFGVPCRVVSTRPVST
jgi:hypothetical protein